jgi:hypothetical protein
VIRGFFASDLPFVPGRIFVLSAADRLIDVDLLVDTGARLSVLRHAAAGALGIDIERELARAPRDIGVGIGGSEEFLRIRIGLVLPDDSFGDRTFRPVFRVALADSQPGLPSLLGMDLLSAFDLRISRAHERVEMAPASR